MSSSLWHIKARVNFKLAEALVTFFEEQNFQAISWIECEDSNPSTVLDDNNFPIAEEFWVECYSPLKPDKAILKVAIESYLELWNEKLISFSIEPVDHTDWLEACYKSLPPRVVGDFYIFGKHVEEKSHPQKLSVQVDAATAFGSGEHPTTTGCLLALSDLSYPDESLTILDMGCGSGILGIAAQKKWPKANVVCVDNDEESVKVTLQNADINKTILKAIKSHGFEDSSLKNTHYDLILANILAKPLCELAPHFAEVLKSKGLVVVSGLLKRQADEVCQSYEKSGMLLKDEKNIDDWMTLIFEKK